MRASGGDAAMGSTMPRSPDGSRTMGQDSGLQFERLKERQAHQPDALKVRWTSGINSKVRQPHDLPLPTDNNELPLPTATTEVMTHSMCRVCEISHSRGAIYARKLPPWLLASKLVSTSVPRIQLSTTFHDRYPRRRQKCGKRATGGGPKHPRSGATCKLLPAAHRCHLRP